MKPISRRILASLLGLCAVSLMLRGVVADEMADWMAEMRRQNDEFNRQEQQRREDMDRFNREAQEAREAMDKFNREAQKERDAWYEWNRQVQEWRDNEKKQQEWDEWRNRLTGDTAAAAPASGSVAVTAKSTLLRSAELKSTAPKSSLPKARFVRPAGARQFWFPARAFAQQPLVIVNPFVSQSTAAENQERPAREESFQVIENPFVRSSR